MNLEQAKESLKLRRKVVQCEQELHYLQALQEIPNKNPGNQIFEMYALEDYSKKMEVSLNQSIDDLRFGEIYYDDDLNYDVDFVSLDDYWIHLADAIRGELGYEDLSDAPEVYYNFYIRVTEVDVMMEFVCNHGEKDDYAVYEIPLIEKEKNEILIKLEDLRKDDVR